LEPILDAISMWKQLTSHTFFSKQLTSLTESPLYDSFQFKPKRLQVAPAGDAQHKTRGTVRDCEEGRQHRARGGIQVTMSSFGYTLESNRSSRFGTARSTGTKKRRNYDYELDKLRKVSSRSRPCPSLPSPLHRRARSMCADSSSSSQFRTTSCLRRPCRRRTRKFRSSATPWTR